MGAIVLAFDPVAVRAGPLVLTWHGLFSAAGILVGLYVAAWLASAARVAADAVWGAAWPTIIGGLLGARLLYAAEHVSAFARQPWRLALLNEGGISVVGAVLGGLAGAGWWARRNHVLPTRLLDAVAPGFLVGQAIGRIGDIVNGEHLGAHAPGLPWAVIHTHPNTLGELGVPVHPAVAYELVWDLLSAAVAVWLLRRQSGPGDPASGHMPGHIPGHVPGRALWASLFLYGLGRLWVGVFRLDQRVALGLGLAQLIGACLLPLALLGWWLSRRHGVERVAEARGARRRTARSKAWPP